MLVYKDRKTKKNLNTIIRQVEQYGLPSSAQIETLPRRKAIEQVHVHRASCEEACALDFPEAVVVTANSGCESRRG